MRNTSRLPLPSPQLKHLVDVLRWRDFFEIYLFIHIFIMMACWHCTAFDSEDSLVGHVLGDFAQEEGNGEAEYAERDGSKEHEPEMAFVS